MKLSSYLILLFLKIQINFYLSSSFGIKGGPFIPKDEDYL